MSREGFHPHSGWFFRRGADGSVVVEVTDSASVDAPLAMEISFDANTWASIVASVSAAGETGETYGQALALHGGAE